MDESFGGYDLFDDLNFTEFERDFFGNDSNITDDFRRSLCEDSEEIKIDVAMMVFRSIICAVGMFGNLIVIFVILVLKEYKKAVTHWYVLQLAIADTFFLLTLPFRLSEEAHGQWIFGGVMCSAKESILFINYYSSILFLMVMSIDRYIAVCHGFSVSLKKFRKKKSSYIVTLLVWIVSFIMSIPTMLYSDKRGNEPRCTCSYEFPKDKKTPEEICHLENFGTSNKTLQECVALQMNRTEEESCKKVDCTDLLSILGSGDLTLDDGDYSETINETTPEGQIAYKPMCSYINTGRGFMPYLMFNFVVMFLVPFFVMAVCYCLIAMKLKKAQGRRRSCTAESTGSSAEDNAGGRGGKRRKSAATVKADKNRLRVTIICFALVLLFAICWLPFHAVHLAKMNGIQGSTEYCTILATATSLIAYINSALNPYIYNFSEKRFGKRFRAATGTIRKSVKERTGSISTGSGTVRYVNKSQTSGGTSSNSATVMTKIYRGKTENETTHASSEFDESKQEFQKTSV